MVLPYGCDSAGYLSAIVTSIEKKVISDKLIIKGEISINMLLKAAGYGKLLTLLNNDNSKIIEE